LVLELLRQRGIFCIFSIGFGTVATAWYFLYFFLLVLELLRQRGIFCIFSIGCVTDQKQKKKRQKIQRSHNSSKTKRKNTKNTTLPQQFQNQ
jgi:hypothetical protein